MHGVLFMTNCSRNYLCIDVIMKVLPQTTLNWKWFIKELQIEKITSCSRKFSNKYRSMIMHFFYYNNNKTLFH